ncbi:GYF domain-containing protein [Phragmitibacter flavus]|nr:GYF domain-containing protein [Phragmitibacter flavus]
MNNSNSKWYYLHNGEPAGPISHETVQSKLIRGELHSDDLVCAEGDEDWRSLGESLPELVAATGKAPILPPVSPRGLPTKRTKVPKSVLWVAVALALASGAAYFWKQANDREKTRQITISNLELQLRYAYQSGSKGSVPALIKELHAMAPKSEALISVCMQMAMDSLGRGLDYSGDDAARYLVIAANAGISEAQYMLSRLVMSGKTHLETPQQALARCQSAAEAGLLEAQFQWGLILLRRDGEQSDPNEAVKWLKLAAGRGHTEARYQLATVLLKQNEEDAEAPKWLKEAAEDEHPDAKLMMGLLHLTGQNVVADNSLAFHWIKSAVAAGCSEATLHLGRLYEHGIGTTANVDLAVENYRKAGAAGIVEASLALDKLLAESESSTAELRLPDSVTTYLRHGEIGSPVQ